MVKRSALRHAPAIRFTARVRDASASELILNNEQRCRRVKTKNPCTIELHLSGFHLYKQVCVQLQKCELIAELSGTTWSVKYFFRPGE